MGRTSQGWIIQLIVLLHMESALGQYFPLQTNISISVKFLLLLKYVIDVTVNVEILFQDLRS